jgi:5-methylcytosine-specific restriction enzyme subunit McrC
MMESAPSTETEQERFVGRIPVRNLWLLMLYAAQSELAGRGLGGAESPDAHLPDLLAELLTHEVNLRMRRDLSVGYRSRQDDLRRLRGRVDQLETERRQLLSRGLVACTFSELTRDTVRNRYVKAALLVLARSARSERAMECRAAAAMMERSGVVGPRPGRALIAADRTARHDAQDATMVALAKLALLWEIPSEELSDRPIYLPSREEHWVRRLFERAVFGFYQHALKVPVDAPKLDWQIREASAGALALMPEMRTDIRLRFPDRQLIIDTKFTEITTGRSDEASRYGKETFKSGYIYQLLAYLRAMAALGGSERVDGMLLHPAVGTSVNEWVRFDGHSVRFATVDLTGTAWSIRERLLQVAGPPSTLS